MTRRSSFEYPTSMAFDYRQREIREDKVEPSVNTIKWNTWYSREHREPSDLTTNIERRFPLQKLASVS